MGKEVKELVAGNLRQSPHQGPAMLTGRGTFPKARAGFPKLSGHETPFPRSTVFRNWSHRSVAAAHLLTKGAAFIPSKASGCSF